MDKEPPHQPQKVYNVSMQTNIKRRSLSMNIIPQLSLFGEEENEELGDLERLKMALCSIPDEQLIRRLYKIRGKGRNDWSVEAMWNSFIASFIFEHETVESLLRELKRNSQLRKMCGFTPKSVRQPDGTYKIYVAPSESSYSKFLANLKKCQDELNQIFQELVDYMYTHLDGFGSILMTDGKAIQSFGTKVSKNDKSGERGEHDATYELPVAFAVTKASNSETKESQKLLKEMKKTEPEQLGKCQYFLADKGYDGAPLTEWLEGNEITPIIDIRNCWKDKEETHQYKDSSLVYNYEGKVWYVDEAGEKIELVYRGYDKGTDSSRYGFKPQKHDKRVFRIKCSEDIRIFSHVGRQSHKWKRLYAMRSGIERINGRIDRDYKFEKHTIRGLEKMKMFINVTFIVYLAMAKAKIERGEKEHLTRLYA